MLQALLYVFENCIRSHEGMPVNFNNVEHDLSGAGFPLEQIEHVRIWLEDYAHELHTSTYHGQQCGARVFSEKEYRVLGTQAINTLISLEQNGILNARTREIVVSRLLALKEATILAYHVRCVVLFVLFSYPEGEEALSKMDYFVRLENDQGVVRH